jgi:hypothetical protein
MPGRRPGLLPTAILVSAMLAGCSGGGDGPTADTQDAVAADAPGTQDPAPTTGSLKQASAGTATEAAQGNGEIRGRVQDNGDLPVAAATVAVLGTEATTRTDPEGAFAFANVTPGKHRLRVDSADYVAHEGDVVVEAGRVTEVVITVVPPAGQDAGALPHLHDLWGGKTTLLLADVAVTADDLVLAPNAIKDWPVQLPEQRPDGQPAVVPPGTAEMKVTVTWDPDDITLPRVGLRYETAANDTQYDLPRQASGVPWVIPVKPGENDHGHQRFTLWQFTLFSAGKRGSTDTQSDAALVDGSFAVRIELTRGDLPVDPPHPMHWNGSTEIELRPFAKVSQSLRHAPQACPHVTRLLLDEERVVPPGTGQLRIRFTYKHNTVPPTTPGEPVWRLTWKSADLHPTLTPTGEYAAGAPATPGTVQEFVIPVEPHQADAYYQTKSNWAFAATTGDPLLDECSPGSLGVNFTPQPALSMSFQLEVIAEQAVEP